MIVNIIKSCREIVAIADEELLGRTFFEKNKQLEVKESFYRGENGKVLPKEEVKKLILEMVEEDATFNIVGENSVNCALETGIITENQVLKIDGIPYSLVLL